MKKKIMHLLIWESSNQTIRVYLHCSPFLLSCSLIKVVQCQDGTGMRFPAGTGAIGASPSFAECLCLCKRRPSSCIFNLRLRLLLCLDHIPPAPETRVHVCVSQSAGTGQGCRLHTARTSLTT